LGLKRLLTSSAPYLGSTFSLLRFHNSWDSNGVFENRGRFSPFFFFLPVCDRNVCIPPPEPFDFQPTVPPPSFHTCPPLKGDSPLVRPLFFFCLFVFSANLLYRPPAGLWSKKFLFFPLVKAPSFFPIESPYGKFKARTFWSTFVGLFGPRLPCAFPLLSRPGDLFYTGFFLREFFTFPQRFFCCPSSFFC